MEMTRPVFRRDSTLCQTCPRVYHWTLWLWDTKVRYTRNFSLTIFLSKRIKFFASKLKFDFFFAIATTVYKYQFISDEVKKKYIFDNLTFYMIIWCFSAVFPLYWRRLIDKSMNNHIFFLKSNIQNQFTH